jgi:hypothetical protein
MSEAHINNKPVRNLGYLEWRPDRRTYDAAIKTREALRSVAREMSIGNAEVLAAIGRSCDADVNPFEVLGLITGEQESKVNRSGDFADAAVVSRRLGDRVLTMADVDRGVLAARRELHSDAVRENRLNFDAQEVVFAMADDETAIPRAEDGGGSPLLDHVRRTVLRLHGFDPMVKPKGSAAKYERWERKREIYRRVTGFFRVLAEDPPKVEGDEPWTKYLDQPFATFDKRERRTQVCARVLDPVKEVISRRIDEIDSIKYETRTRHLHLIRMRLCASARSLLGRSGPQRAL